jgi:hypothetical protein
LLTIPEDVEFVPMVRSASDATTTTFAAARRNGKALLCFNEPDLPNQVLQLHQGTSCRGSAFHLDTWQTLQTSVLNFLFKSLHAKLAAILIPDDAA